MANTSAIQQQAAHTTYQLFSPSHSTRAIQKSLTVNQKSENFLTSPASLQGGWWKGDEKEYIGTFTFDCATP